MVVVVVSALGVRCRCGERSRQQRQLGLVGSTAHVGDEAGHDFEVRAADDLVAIRTFGRRRRTIPFEMDCERESLMQPAHRVERTNRIGQDRRHVRVDRVLVALESEQFLYRSTHLRERADHR